MVDNKSITDGFHSFTIDIISSSSKKEDSTPFNKQVGN